MQEEYTEEDLYYHLRAVARLLDLSPRTILKYERLGLIQCEEIVVEGRIRHRCYTPDTLDRLRKIRWLTMDFRGESGWCGGDPRAPGTAGGDKIEVILAGWTAIFLLYRSNLLVYTNKPRIGEKPYDSRRIHG